MTVTPHSPLNSGICHSLLSNTTTTMVSFFEKNKKILKRVGIGAGLGLGVATLGLVAVPVALGAAGFGAGGVVAGSAAAAIQAGIGNVAAGSLFAVCQSVGAAGLATSTMVGATAAGTVAGVAGGAVTHVVKGKDEGPCSICNKPLKHDEDIHPCGHCHENCSSKYSEIHGNPCPRCDLVVRMPDCKKDNSTQTGQ